jgi:hypothetical protein
MVENSPNQVTLVGKQQPKRTIHFFPENLFNFWRKKKKNAKIKVEEGSGKSRHASRTYFKKVSNGKLGSCFFTYYLACRNNSFLSLRGSVKQFLVYVLWILEVSK